MEIFQMAAAILFLNLFKYKHPQKFGLKQQALWKRRPKDLCDKKNVEILFKDIYIYSDSP
jgi:hypothetical protein